MLLKLLVVLGCVLSACSAAEYDDDTWIYSSAGDRGRATVLPAGGEGDQRPGFPSSALPFVKVYKHPKTFIPRNVHPLSMLYYIPAWHHSKHAEEAAKPVGLPLDRQVGNLRWRLFDAVKDGEMTPSIRETSDEIEDSDIPTIVDGTETKRNADTEEENQPQPSSCGTLNNYLCWGMNHPMCHVRYPAPVSTQGDSKCRVVVRCNYTSEFFSKQAFCFAVRKAFPPPQLDGVDQTSLSYNHTVKLNGNQGMPPPYQIDVNTTVARNRLNDSIVSYAPNGLNNIQITTDYLCAQMTPCLSTA